jgi:hypothetical protein
MRRAFEECVAATGKVSNALIIRTYVVIFANQRISRVRAEHVGRHARTNEVKNRSSQPGPTLRFIKFFSKMLVSMLASLAKKSSKLVETFDVG